VIKSVGHKAFRRKPKVEEPSEHPKGFDDFELRLGDIMRGERATLGKSLLDVQRELKIKAAYISAIENSDPTAFEIPGFVAGYVRSYARYLNLDPEWAYKLFCDEGKFQTAHGMSPAASGLRKAEIPGGKPRVDPFSDPKASFVPKAPSFLSRIEPAAVGSVAVLVALIGLIGYGGMAVLSEVQKVRIAPVEQAPVVVTELDPMAGSPEPIAFEVDSQPPSTGSFDRIYRPGALDVPVMTARDAPIATLDPRENGALVDQPRLAASEGPRKVPRVTGAAAPREFADLRPDVAVAEAEVVDTPQVVEDAPPGVVMFAVRPAWVRVKSASGAVIFEKVMEPGDEFVLPATEEPATLRTGNAGSVYFLVGGETYGPAGEGPSIASNVAMGPEDLRGTFAIADLEADSALKRYAEARAAAETPVPAAAAE